MRVEEFEKILLGDNPDKEILSRFSDIISLIPELAAMKDFHQNNRYHIYDVLNHTLEVVKHTDADLVLRLSALFHDLGKPHTYTIDERGQGHFYGHGEVSVELTRAILERLGYDNEVINDVLTLITYHDYPLYLREKPLMKLLKQIDHRLIEKLFLLKRADILGQNPEYRFRLDELEQAKQMLKKLI